MKAASAPSTKVRCYTGNKNAPFTVAMDQTTGRSYPFPVWSGLIAATHRKRIGIAIWMFLWLLDRTTGEKDGVGIVLGGRPVKDEEIATSLGVHKNSVATDRLTLLKGDYVAVVRTPYGYTYRVRKSRKFGIWGRKRDLQKPVVLPSIDPQETVIPDPQKPVETKKTMHKHHAAKAAGIDDNSKEGVWGFLGIDPCGPLPFRTLLESCWTSRNGDLPSVVIGRALDAWEDTEGNKPPRCVALFKALAGLRKRESSNRSQKKFRIPTGEQMIPKR